LLDYNSIGLLWFAVYAGGEFVEKKNSSSGERKEISIVVEFGFKFYVLGFRGS